MMFENVRPYSKKLDDGLIMKSVSSIEDVEKLVLFTKLIHGEENDARLIKTLILEHPYSKPNYFLFIENEKDNTIVSSLCLIPWIWRYKEVEIRTGEMGFVGTLKEYRNKGLIRLLNKRFVELLIRDEFLMSHIQGIAFFYKQFGYEYAIPLEGGFRIDPHYVEETLVGNSQKIKFRKATKMDIPILEIIYEKSALKFDITSIREEQIWNFLLGPAMSCDSTMEIWNILDENDNITGYFRITQVGFGEGLILTEVSNLTYVIAQAVLKKLKDLCKEYNKPFIRLNIHQNTTLTKVALNLGAINLGHYAWQIKIIDLKKFIEKMSNILEKRIKSSAFKNLTEKIVINLYRVAIELNFIDGKIKNIDLVQFSRNDGFLRIPPNLFIPLVLGYYSREDLVHHHHDFLYNKKNEHLIDVMFPKVDSFIYTIY